MRTARATGDPKGWLVPIESIEQAEGQVLMLGTDTSALAPAALRARVARIVRSLAKRYVRG